MGDFLVMTDINYVTVAIGRRFIVCVTLVDAGHLSHMPLVDIALADGDVLRNLMIPGPGGASPPYPETQRAVELFFDSLAGKGSDDD